MKRTGRTALLLLLGSSGFVMAAAAVLVFTVPSFKHAVKERWHLWSCPDLPALRTDIELMPSGAHMYKDPFTATAEWGTPNLLFGFDPPVPPTDIGPEDVFSGTGALQCDTGSCPAILRIVRDVADTLVSISTGIMLKCPTTEPDIRIVIRIDHPDGTLLEWNEKRLIAGEHRPNEWERFNFEWILRDLSIGPDNLVAIFLIGDSAEEIWIDDLSIVFRSARPLPPTADPHA